MNKRNKIDDYYLRMLDVKVPVQTKEETVYVPLNNILDNNQIASIATHLVNTNVKSNLEQIIEFQESFKIPKETTHIVEDFKSKELRFRLILEECLELGKALGLKSGEQYLIYRELADKVEKSEIEVSIFEVVDALIDLLYVTYGALQTFDMENITNELYAEVHRSNMSKLISTNNPNFLDIIKKSVTKYSNENIKVFSVDLKNGYYSINHSETNKILKPVGYSRPDLISIVEKHINIKNKK